MTFARLNLCGQIVHDLGCRIVRGDVQPGEALPQEDALCEQLGVSRTVVREAIKSLAAKGLLESRPKRGTVVRSQKSWNLLDPDVLDWQGLSDLNGQHLLHLTELRQAIEPAAAALAAARAPDTEVRRIAEACEAMADSAEDVEGFLAADFRFHTGILHAAGNPLFAPVAHVISASLRTSLRVTNRQPRDNHASVPVHRKVTDAIRARNATDARSAMQDLLHEAEARIRRALAPEA